MDVNKIFNNNFIIICLIGFLSSFGTSIAETIVMKYSEFLGAVPSMIGIVSGVCSISALLILPLSAPILDVYKKNIIFATSTIVLVTAYVGFAYSSSVNMLIVFRLLNGIGKGISFTVCLAMAADALPKEKLASGVVYFTLAQAISIAFAPGVGLYLLERFSYFNTFIVSAGITLIAVCLAFIVKISHKKASKITISFKTMIAKEAILPATLMFFLATSYSTINSFIVIYAGELTIVNIGLYFTVYSLVLLISRPLVSKLSNFLSISQIIIPSLLCFGVSMYFVSISRSLTMFILAAVVSAFGYGICQPLVQSICIQRVGENRRGVGSSTSFIGTNMGYLVGPFVGGMLAEQCGYSFMYKMMVIPLLCGLGIYIYDKKRNDKESGEKYETNNQR